MPNLGPNFYQKLVQISSEVGMKPEDLIAVMVSESGMNPAAVEKQYKGSGLIGFMPDTLKGLGFKGTWEDFIKLSGEQQLDYVEAFIKNKGQKFNSAPQYYVANFWPAALKLPGIKAEDPNTAFIESNPQVVTEPKTGRKWSKKYYDVGIKIDPTFEHSAYKANPLFDKNKRGAITYGDMIERVNDIKKQSSYKNIIASLTKSTGYQPGKENTMVVHKDDLIKRYMNKYKDQDQGIDSYQQVGNQSQLNNTLNKYLQEIAASDKSNKKLYKKFLPLNHLVINVTASEFVDAVEFSRILCAALDEELMAEAFTHTNGNIIDVECSISGPEHECFKTVKQLTESLSEVFKNSTIKIGGIDVKTKFFMNKKSSYQQMDAKTANAQHRKFLIKFI
jgi:hypothetical protein